MNELFTLAKKLSVLNKVPSGRAILYAMLFLVAWTGLMLAMSYYRKNWRGAIPVLNIALTALGLALVLLFTLVRKPRKVARSVLIPLRPLLGMKTVKSYWHSMLLNILLFIPFSCGLTFCIGRKGRRPAVTAMLLCFLLSLAVEGAQYVFRLGTFEMDDLLMNSLGGVIGTIPQALVARFCRKH